MDAGKEERVDEAGAALEKGRVTTLLNMDGTN